ncbi:MAG: RnfABCDGE type electron transport complex subunit B [Spirochaetaceae bacterium]|jgi:RnfABCDGE-type electron transport complex B subunit|nr:RnfABCDGE type electron transport complex subunit B [Spirochaetaceae bacterium]
MNTILLTAIFAASLTLILGVLLGIFRKVFHVESDVLVSLIRETLPGANCGACGFPGCDGFAAAVSAKEAEPDKCTVSDAKSTKKRAELVGSNADIVPLMVVLACRGSRDRAQEKGIYTGEKNCRGAKIASQGVKLCSWACIGFGDCITVCQFGAITMGENGLPFIDRTKCTGCGMCAAECPQLLLKIVPRDREGVIALCQNRNPIRAQIRKNCAAGCIKCGICVKKCPNQAIEIINGIPEIDYKKCSSCGLCVGVCPAGTLRELKTLNRVDYT